MAFCANCGAQLNDGAAFCGNCGARQAAVQQPAQQYQQPYQSYQQPAQQYQQPAQQYQQPAQQYQQPAQAYQQPYQSYQQQATAPSAAYAGSSASGRFVRSDRSILTYVLLSIITLGIYAYWYIYKLAQDMNTVCNDGDKTPGLAAYILLSIVTCGIYSIWWEYKIANRQQANAAAYGFTIQENGTSVLLWHIVGILLCGLGPFIAMNIIIKNMNMLATAYNNRISQAA